MANEITKCGNPFELGKPVYISTPEQMAEWLNNLAIHVGVFKTEKNPNGYKAIVRNGKVVQE